VSPRSAAIRTSEAVAAWFFEWGYKTLVVHEIDSQITCIWFP
jgi:hypothetical protein